MDEKKVRARVREMLAEQGRVVVLATVDGDGRPKCRYMTGLTLDGDNVLYMVSSARGRKVEQIRANPLCQVCLWTEDWEETVELNGRAQVVDSMEKKEDIWRRHPVFANYFASPGSESYALIQVTLDDGEYVHIHKEGMPVAWSYGGGA